MNIIVIDDHPILDVGIKEILSNKYDRVQFYNFNDIDKIANSSNYKKSNLVILLFQPTYCFRTEVSKSIENLLQNNKTLVLSTSNKYSDFKKIMEMNAKGYLHISAEAEDLLYSLESIENGRRFVDSSFIDDIMNDSKELLIETLTPREHQIFKLIGEGLSNTEISQVSFISVNTVKKHVNRIISKLDVHDRIHVLLISKDYY